MKAAVLLSLLLALAWGPLAAEEEAAPAPRERWSAEIGDLRGEVFVQRAGSRDFKPAEKKQELFEGDTVRTGADGEAEIEMDGSGVIMLEKNSRFQVSDTLKSQGVLKLMLGTLLSKFQSLKGGDVLKVKSKSAVAAVRGTEFGVFADEAGCRVGVFDEGVVQVTGPGEEGGVTLNPNQETSVAEGAEPLPPSSLKFFAFHRARMVQIRKRLDTIRKNWRKKNKDQRDELKRKLNRYRRRGGAEPKDGDGGRE